ncbi:MAG TPA: hypothetical protein PKC14_03355, partial [Candidatus Absconditabacterales bacterium]|nr:hypothetical protein [Candidatus Absconditabacterales bacterium]
MSLDKLKIDTLKSQDQLKINETEKILDGFTHADWQTLAEDLKKPENKEFVSDVKNLFSQIFEKIKGKPVETMSQQEVKILESYIAFVREEPGVVIDGVLTAEESLKVNGFYEAQLYLAQKADKPVTSAEGLKQLGVDFNSIPAWTSLVNKIKTTDDVDHVITAETISSFVGCKNVKPENLPYVAKNFTDLMKKYLTVFPGYKDPFRDEGFITGMNLENMIGSVNYYWKTMEFLQKLSTESEKKQFEAGNIAFPSTEDGANKLRLFLLSEYFSKGEQVARKLYSQIPSGSPLEKSILAFEKHSKLKNIVELYVDEKLKPYTVTVSEGFMKGNAVLAGGSSLIEKLTPGKDSALKIPHIESARQILNTEYGKKIQDATLQYEYLQDMHLNTMDAKSYQKYSTEIEPYGSQIKKLSDELSIYQQRTKAQAEYEDLNMNYKTLTAAGRERWEALKNAPRMGYTLLRIKTEEIMKKVYTLALEQDKAYVKALLAVKPKPLNTVISAPHLAKLGIELKLDFSHNNFEDVMRDSFSEGFSDGLKQFWEDVKNDPLKATITLTSMMAAGAVSTVVTLGTQNPWLAGMAFSGTYRGASGVLTSLRQAGGAWWDGEDISDAAVEGFGKGFGYLDNQGNYIGNGRFALDLVFDVATSGIVMKMNPLGDKMWKNTLSGLGWGSPKKETSSKTLKFTGDLIVNELILENVVDIGMVTLNAGVSAYFGVEGPVTNWKPIRQSFNTSADASSQDKGSVGDVLDSMKDAFSQQLNPQNLGNLFASSIAFSTAMSGSKSGMNWGLDKSSTGRQIQARYDALELKSIDTLAEIKGNINALGVTLIENAKKQFVFVDMATKKEVMPDSPRYKPLENIVQKGLDLAKEQIQSLESFKNDMSKILNDPNNPEGQMMVFLQVNKLNSDSLPPDLLLKSRLQSVESEIKNAKTPAEKNRLMKVKEGLTNLLTEYGNRKKALDDKKKFQEMDGKKQEQEILKIDEQALQEGMDQMKEAESLVNDYQKLDNDQKNLSQKEFLKNKISGILEKLSLIVKSLKSEVENSLSSVNAFDSQLIKLQAFLNAQIKETIETGYVTTLSPLLTTTAFVSITAYLEGKSLMKNVKSLVSRGGHAGDFSMVEGSQSGDNSFDGFAVSESASSKADVLTQEIISSINKSSKNKVPDEIIRQNAMLDDAANLLKAEELLGIDLNDAQKKAVTDAHNVGTERGAQVGEYTQREISQKVRILSQAGLNSSQIRILMENGICGVLDFLGLKKKEKVLDEVLIGELNRPQMGDKLGTKEDTLLKKEAILSKNSLDDIKNSTKQTGPQEAKSDNNIPQEAVKLDFVQNFDDMKINWLSKYRDGQKTGDGILELAYMDDLIAIYNTMSNDVDRLQSLYKTTQGEQKARIFDEILALTARAQDLDWLHKVVADDMKVKILENGIKGGGNLKKHLEWIYENTHGEQKVKILQESMNLAQNFDDCKVIYDNSEGEQQTQVFEKMIDLAEKKYHDSRKNNIDDIKWLYQNIKNDSQLETIKELIVDLKLEKKLGLNEKTDQVVENNKTDVLGTEKDVVLQKVDALTQETIIDSLAQEIVLDINKSSKNKISDETIRENAMLGDEQRLTKAEELLFTKEMFTTKGGPKREKVKVGELTDLQKKAVIDAHNVGSERGAQVGNYTRKEISQKVRILSQAGLNSSQIRILMENGICGFFDFLGLKKKEKVLDLDSIAIGEVDRPQILDYLDKTWGISTDSLGDVPRKISIIKESHPDFSLSDLASLKNLILEANFDTLYRHVHNLQLPALKEPGVMRFLSLS